MANKKLVLIDGSSYLFRAYHATARANMSTSTGQPTGAVRTIINMISKLKQEHPADYFAVIFDAKGKTFRHDMYPDYKATRPPMPDELRSQIDYVHRIIRAMGLPLVSVTGVEADDVIGTLANQGTEQKMDVLVSTGDKDMAQLVNEHVQLIDTMKNVIYDRQGVIDKFGIAPEQIIDYLALMGDSSDNIPGVPKVGPKTAVKWLVEYTTLDNLLEHKQDIGGKVGENLRDNLEQLALSKELTTIACDLSLEVAIEDLTVAEPDQEQLVELYTELEFNTWLEEMGVASDSAEQAPASLEAEYELIVTSEQLAQWLQKLEAAELMAFDTETTSLNTLEAQLVGVSFSVEAGKAAYLPLAHTVGNVEQLDFEQTLAQIKPLLENPDVKKVGQNLKYDANVLKNYDIHLDGIEFDTMLESYVLDSVGSRHDMDSLSVKHLGHKPISFESIAGKGKNQLTFDQIEIEQAGEYAAEDADITLRLHQSLWPKLEQEPTLQKILAEIEMPLLEVLAKVERNGVKIDSEMLFVQSQQLASSMDHIESQAYELAGAPFNMASPKQIQEILFEQMQIPVLRKTPKGQPSTAEDVLQELAFDYELPRLILDHRGMGKLKSTYTDKLPLMINEKTGRVHTSYHQAVAITGRLSSTDPNLQNIPIKSAEGRRIRQAFVVDEGHKMVAADYSQIELRIMAHLSGDEALLSAFNAGADIHTATAAEIMAVAPDEVTSEHRRRAKAINFGLIYGMSAFGLAKQLGLKRGEAQDYIDLYFARYPGVKQYMDDVREKARDLGYVETVLGRRLYLPDINGKNHQRRQYAERTAINAPMQGTAADLIKLAMITIQEQLEQGQFATKMIMQVHDELVFEVPDAEMEQIKPLIIDAMQNVASLRVPLIVDVGIGTNWDEAH